MPRWANGAEGVVDLTLDDHFRGSDQASGGLPGDFERVRAVDRVTGAQRAG